MGISDSMASFDKSFHKKSTVTLAIEAASFAILDR